MRSILRHVLKSSIRDSLFFGISMVNVCFLCIAVFMGSNALVEKLETTIGYVAFTLRFVTIFSFAIFVSFYFKKIFDNKEIDIFLSKAISRTKIIIAFLLGMLLLFVPFLMFAFIGLLLVKIKLNLALIWLLSFWFEAFAVIAVALFFNLMMNSKINGLLFTLMFYFMARMIGGFLPYLNVYLEFSLYNLFSGLMKLLSIFIPRFDLLAHSNWLLGTGGDYQSLLLGLLQSFVFGLFVVCMCIIDFRKKEF